MRSGLEYLLALRIAHRQRLRTAIYQDTHCRSLHPSHSPFLLFQFVLHFSLSGFGQVYPFRQFSAFAFDVLYAHGVFGHHLQAQCTFIKRNVHIIFLSLISSLYMQGDEECCKQIHNLLLPLLHIVIVLSYLSFARTTFRSTGV